MLAAQFAPPGKFEKYLFYPAWTLVFIIAVAGTGFEVAVGNACPKSSSGVPMCYFSLALCVAIVLFQNIRPSSPFASRA
jgi:hypothetical protein